MRINFADTRNGYVRAGVFVAAFLNAVAVFGQDHVSFSKTFTSDNNPVTVDFRAWMPANLDRIRGVVFSIPGSGGDTRNITTNGSWRGKLTGMGFAIIGNRYTTVSGGGDFYWGTSQQEIQANMLNMISGMATALGRPEINNAPLIIEGVSHGGYATNDIVQSIPERVLGYVEDKGTTYLWADAAKAEATSRVPGLLVLASDDDAVPPIVVNSSFQNMRTINSRVAQEIDWTGHQNTNPDTRFAFIDQVYRLRYPHGQVPSLVPGNPLAPVELPLAGGWVGEVNTVNFFPPPTVEALEWPAITPANQYQFVSGPEERSWLPYEAMALVYRAHNAVPAGIGLNALGIVAANAKDRNVNGGAPIDLSITLTEIAYSGIDVYHENQLIAHLLPTSGQQHVLYTPTDTGIHTFAAVASYQYNGQTHYASEYTTVGVAFISTSIKGDFNHDGFVDAADYTVWRDSLGQSGLGLAADGTGALGPPDGVVDQLDYNLWKSHFGQTAPSAGSGSSSGALAAAQVPEPATQSLLVIVMVGMAASTSRFDRWGA